MSIFEAVMLVCFSVAWPFSIHKAFCTRRNDGKSIGFLIIVFAGYISGIIHKFLFNFDAVIVLYFLNAFMVFLDIAIYLRNRSLSEQEPA